MSLLVRLAYLGVPVPFLGAITTEVSSTAAYAAFAGYILLVVVLMALVRRKERRHGR